MYSTSWYGGVEEGWGQAVGTVAAAGASAIEGAQTNTPPSPSGSMALWSQMKSKLAQTATGGNSWNTGELFWVHWRLRWSLGHASQTWRLDCPCLQSFEGC